MNTIRIADATLLIEECVLGFKEKLEIARQLEKLEVDVIELPYIQNEKADILLIRTISSIIKKSTLSIGVTASSDSLASALAAVSSGSNIMVRIDVPVSPVGMEYHAHKKPDALLEFVSTAVAAAKQKGCKVELCAIDATRADLDFLYLVLKSAEDAGVDYLTVCDSASEMLPDDFADFVKNISQHITKPLGVSCSNRNGMAAANALLAVRNGATLIKTDVIGSVSPLENVVSVIKNCGNYYQMNTTVLCTELNRIAKQIRWIITNVKNEKAVMTVNTNDDQTFRLDANDCRETVISAAQKLGYDLSDEDQKNVFDEFQRVAKKKTVGIKELDAIVASTAMQVPATYKLISYVINNGNIISSSAQIALSKGDDVLNGVCIGDGPIDAAFRAIDQIIGHHYELDDFQIQSVTEGKEAMGSALVKLRSDGKLFSGNGISTDIIGASIRAYLNAVNKIAHEEF